MLEQAVLSDIQVLHSCICLVKNLLVIGKFNNIKACLVANGVQQDRMMYANIFHLTSSYTQQ
jgi:hypothetical protein